MKYILYFFLFCGAFFLGFSIKQLMIEKNTIHIAFAANDKYATPVTTSIASILFNSHDREFFHFYILDDHISNFKKEHFKALQKLKKHKLEFIKVDNSLFKIFPTWSGGVTTYYRYVLPEIAPKLSKILYLDGDTLVLGSLKKLWETDMGENYCAAVKGFCDTCPQVRTEKKNLGVASYFNAGVLLLNLKKMRDDNIPEKLYDNTIFLNKRRLLKWMDQSVMNYTFKNKVEWLDRKYNVQLHTEEQKEILNPVILHFIYNRPWNTKNVPYWHEYDKVIQILKSLNKKSKP